MKRSLSVVQKALEQFADESAAAVHAEGIMVVIYKEKYDKSELLVSSKNYIGLNFWVKNGYTEITRVFSSEEQNTISTELNLRKKICR